MVYGVHTFFSINFNRTMVQKRPRGQFFQPFTDRSVLKHNDTPSHMSQLSIPRIYDAAARSFYYTRGADALRLSTSRPRRFASGRMRATGENVVLQFAYSKDTLHQRSSNGQLDFDYPLNRKVDIEFWLTNDLHRDFVFSDNLAEFLDTTGHAIGDASLCESQTPSESEVETSECLSEDDGEIDVQW